MTFKIFKEKLEEIGIYETLSGNGAESRRLKNNLVSEMTVEQEACDHIFIKWFNVEDVQQCESCGIYRYLTGNNEEYHKLMYARDIYNF
jgi:hypothetical protein